MIEVIVEDDRWQGLDPDALVTRAVRAALDHLGVAEDELAVLLADDARIAALNADFRGKPRPTNVLSWPAAERAAEDDGATPGPPGPGEGLGDIALAFETCEAEARDAGRPLADHATHLVVHGLLHCLGYDHERDGDATLMERLEVEILGNLGLDDPYSVN